MLASIAVSFHRWPWSVDVEEESVPVSGDSIELEFFGSPVLSVMSGTKVLLSSRHEKFIPLGPPFQKGAEVYEAPHGILSQASHGRGKMMIISKGIRRNLDVKTEGAQPRTKDDSKSESPLARMVLGWSQFFDDLLDDNSNNHEQTGKIRWDDVLEFLKRQKADLQQPRLSLIVRIAEEMSINVPVTISGMRRILFRERGMQRISRICETDVRCMQWYVRQPGQSMAEKGGTRQELMAVVRRESFDVLENRVLKDFIHRCSGESLRYITTEVEINPNFVNSKRALDVRRFREICAAAAKHPDFEGVPRAGAGVRPNYVLQNDLRYRSVWKWYRRLLRREEEEDRFWDWQTRTWADIVRILVNSAIVFLKCEGLKPQMNGTRIREISGSSLQVTREQLLGSRTYGGSEPGPFVVERLTKSIPHPAAILEVVHPDDAHEHILAQNLGRTGGHLYLVVRPLEKSINENHVLIVWGVNTAGTVKEINWEDVAKSAANAIRHHRSALLSDRIPNLPKFQGLVVASNLYAEKADFVCEDSNAPIVIAPSDPRHWRDMVEYFAVLIGERLDRLV